MTFFLRLRINIDRKMGGRGSVCYGYRDGDWIQSLKIRTCGHDVEIVLDERKSDGFPWATYKLTQSRG